MTPVTDSPDLAALRKLAVLLADVQVERVPAAHHDEARQLLDTIRALALWYGRRLLAARALGRKDAGL